MSQMNNLKTKVGFFVTYFELLPQFETQIEWFSLLHNEMEKINGDKMFKNNKDFKNYLYKDGQ